MIKIATDESDFLTLGKIEKIDKRTLVAGVGHRFWQDYSAGPAWIDRMKEIDWPEGLDVEDYSFGALAMTQNLQDVDYQRIVFLSAEARGRQPGTLHWYRYAAGEESPERVQAYVGESGGGVVAIDPLLSIAGHFGVLPPETWVIELEPIATKWGDEESRAIEANFSEVLQRVRRLLSGDAPTKVEVRRDA